MDATDTSSPKNNSTLRLYFRLFAYVKPYGLYFIISGILTLLYATANVFIMPLMRDVSRIITAQRMGDLNIQMGYAVILVGTRLLTQFSQVYLMNFIGNRMMVDLRVALYQKLHYLSSDFHSKNKLGDLISRLITDVDNVRQGLLKNFEKVLPQSLTLIGVIGYLLYQDWSLTLLAIVGIPFFIYVTHQFGARLRRVSGRLQRKRGDLNHVVHEALLNIRVVKAFTREEKEIDRFKTESEKAFFADMKIVLINCILAPLIEFAQFVVILLVIWYGAFKVASNQMDGPTLISFFTGIMLLIDPVVALSGVYTDTQNTLASAKRLFDVLDEPNGIESKPGAQALKNVSGKMVFESVSFTYPDAHTHALHDISLTVQPGEIVALVGTSGAGKSTLVNLIPRFYDPTSGTIRLDSIDLRDIDLFSLRSHIGIVPQESALFRGSILENIRYGRLDATKEEVTIAAKKANAWEFIEKYPNKLRTRIGDRGHRLSGGQKQRIAIARAILRDPKILILDEATSALDSESEKLVQDALVTLMENRTTFVIAHRLSTIMHAHKIVVMDNGQIAESGTHQSLLDKNGVYANLYRIQFLQQTTS